MKTQLIWTCLPQGFKNSPTLFSDTPTADLAAFPREDLNHILMQYVGDLLLASRRREDSWEGTKVLLQLLTEARYKVSWKKGQICRQQVWYLGFVITKGHQSLGLERKKVICSMPAPNTKRKLQEFLGAAGFCRIWIPGFSDIARSLYKALTGLEDRPLE
ncbi:hypothetical protein AAY473_024136 [Plecturocebus cupreus]